MRTSILVTAVCIKDTRLDNAYRVYYFDTFFKTYLVNFETKEGVYDPRSGNKVVAATEMAAILALAMLIRRSTVLLRAPQVGRLEHSAEPQDY